ncbi:trypsin-like peptidase domain-containing protein [Ruminococcaceae bacterium OttesenSCG-928-I18]|nr:trypsin-like peptidase domain-containing protein [Ruminococcaceae bacterium OttesenSCG-928-I18]
MRINRVKKSIKKAVASLFALCFLAVFTLPVAASDGSVPQVVLDARQGVVRIVNEGADFIATGTGFAVGSERQPYIVTNYHVVEDSEELFIFYDTGRYVEGRVYKEYPGKDLAVIKPSEPIPDVQPLPLATGVVDSGQAVYALGFPGASDMLAQGFDEQEYDSLEDYLQDVVADKQSMTVTNGIISAIRTSNLISYNGEEEVKMVQTNAAINNGNSGGPLLNAAGHVVGVNAIGLSGFDTIEAMNGSIHVDELARVLKKDGVPYTLSDGTGTAEGQGLTPTPEPSMDPTTIAVVAIGLVVAVAAIAVVVVVLVRNRKPSVKREMTLLQFERGNFRMNELELLDKTMRFLQELTGLEKGTDVYTLLTPENILVGPKGISLRKKKNKEEDAGAIKIYPGYSAPESYDNRSSEASSVYFVGAMMSLLLTGNRPENALRRKENGSVAFPNAPDTLQQIINEAMDTAEATRLPDLYSLQYRLGNAVVNIQYENGYMQAQYTGY